MIIYKVMKSGRSIFNSTQKNIAVKYFYNWEKAHNFLMAQNFTNWWWWIEPERIGEKD